MERRSAKFQLSGFAIFALVILSAASGLMTYQGLKIVMASVAAPWLTYVVAGVMSLAITVMIFAFWRTAFDAIGAFRRGLPIGYGMLITVCFVPFIIGISSWFNVTGIAGQSAMEHHLIKSLGRIEVAIDARAAGSMVSDQFGPALQLAANSYAKEASAECSSGPRTGSGGEGTVCYTLRAVAAQLNEIANVRLPSATQGSVSVAGEARALLQEMRQVAAGRGTVDQKTIEVARLLDQLRGAMAAMNGNRSVALLRAGVSALPGETSKRALSAKSEAGRARQQAALNDLNRELRLFADEVIDRINALPPEVSGVLPPLERLNAAIAVYRYAGHYVPFWIAGIALDLMPLALLFFLLVQRACMTEEEQMIGEVLDRTNRDIVLDKYGEMLRRAPGPDTNTVRDAVSFATGRLPRLEDRSADNTKSYDTDGDDNA